MQNRTKRSSNDITQAGRQLEALGHTIAWYGETHLLCRGIGRLVRDFVVLPTTAAGRDMCRTAGYQVGSLLDFAPTTRPRRPESVLAFKRTTDLDRVEVENPSVRNLCPRGGFQDLMGDKTLLPCLPEDAHVPVIPSLTVAPAALAAASQIWDLFRNERLVVQNGKTISSVRGLFW